jgi:outer membrane protein
MLSSLLRKSNLALLIVLACGASAGAVDFETVYQAALKNSTELLRIRAQHAEAVAMQRASNSRFMPKAGVESRYETFDSTFERVKGGTASAFAEWNLFNGFKDVQNRKSLIADSSAVEVDKNIFEKNFKWLAMAKYTRAQIMQENVETYKRVIQSNLKNLQTIRIRKSSGRLSDADYLEFQLFDSKLKQDLIALETEASAALADLEAFSGIKSISQLSTQLKPAQLKLENIKMHEVLDSSQSQQYKNQLKVESAEARQKLATGGFLPEVNLRASYGSNGLRETSIAPESSFALVARWELFSGFETYNNRQIAAAQLAKARAELENNRIQYLSQAEQLRKKLKSIWSRLEFEEKNQKNIDLFLKTVQEEYQRGVKNSNDLKSALELVLETQLNRASLRSDYFTSRAALQEILGIEIEEE